MHFTLTACTSHVYTETLYFLTAALGGGKQPRRCKPFGISHSLWGLASSSLWPLVQTYAGDSWFRQVVVSKLCLFSAHFQKGFAVEPKALTQQTKFIWLTDSELID